MFVLNCQSVVPQGISLLDRPERSYRPKVRHFAVVDAILYPPKVSSERVVDDVGTDGNNRRNGSKVPYLWLTCLNGYKGTTFAKGDVRLCPIDVIFTAIFSFSALPPTNAG